MIKKYTPYQKEKKIMFRAKKLFSIFIGLVVLGAAISACASATTTEQALTTPQTGEGLPDTGTSPDLGSPGTGVNGLADLVAALTAAGAEVEAVGSVEQDFFDVTGQMLKVNGMEVQVFEFADEAARKTISDQISPDASTIITSMVEWVDQPNFWASGRLIVLYLGKDATTIDLLTSLMGAPVTVHE
jgi:ABC-type glycerol-3-phosphate transport system substrate-binding protein